MSFFLHEILRRYYETRYIYDEETGDVIYEHQPSDNAKRTEWESMKCAANLVSWVKEAKKRGISISFEHPFGKVQTKEFVKELKEPPYSMEASVVSMCKVRFFLLVSPCRVLCDSNFILRAPPSQLDPKQKSRKHMFFLTTKLVDWPPPKCQCKKGQYCECRRKNKGAHKKLEWNACTSSACYIYALDDVLSYSVLRTHKIPIVK